MNSPATSRPIVVGIDGSPSSAAALHQGAALAASLGTGLRVVTCWTVPQFYNADLRLEETEFEADARTAQEELLAAAFASGCPVPLERVLRHGRPGHELVAASADARLLVLGTRGHNEFVSMLLGSVSLECIAHAAVPVLTVRAGLHGPDA
ncbi:universal stress protein [Arthrobacter rhombi]|uniref:universal stress protein n=1 Tax=Arthrobacter rhombi TaxID=71253 RepID=UPI0031DF3C12